MDIERLDLIGKEKDLVNVELELLGFDGEKLPVRNFGYVGTHTLESYSPIMTLYPVVLLGVSQIYGYLNKAYFSEPEQSILLQTYLSDALRNGRLVTNEEAEKIRRDMGDGEYSMQYQSLANDASRKVEKEAKYMQSLITTSDSGFVEKMFSRKRRNNSLYGEYNLMHSDAGVVQNKRIVKGFFDHIQRTLRAYYGEVDFSSALVAEMILDAPFIGSAFNGRATDDEEKHKAYIDQAVSFGRRFNPGERLSAFEEITSSFAVDFTREEPISLPISGDHAYLTEVYKFAKDIFSGRQWSVKELLDIYSHSLLARNRLFKASVVEEGQDIKTQLLPMDKTSISFDQIGGYEPQKDFYQNLLVKVRDRDLRVRDISLIIAAGEPGLGKSLAVKAFLNGLPENARGIIFETARAVSLRGKLPQYEMVTKLASLHPELEIFVILEDMDTLAGERTMSPFAGQFLEMDSVVPDTLPDNMHIIGTTNRLDQIDKAITRPGRASKILIYEAPKNEKERMKIVEIHERSEGYPLSDVLRKHIAAKTSSFTGDEIRHIVWSLAFDGIKEPTAGDIDRVIEEIRQKHKMVKDSMGFQGSR